MRKLLITAAVGSMLAGGALMLPAHATDTLTSPPQHYSSPCQAASTMYQNGGSGANPINPALPGEPTIDLPAPLPSQDNGWSYTDPTTGKTTTGTYGNGATGISGSDGYLEANGDPTTASGHISGTTAGQAGAVPLNGYIGNDGTGNGMVCVAGTKVA